jgi:light-regulated signal transduction histidine kinase (bacteriophytochrome)
VLKDRLARLPSAIRGALHEKHLREERERAQRELGQKMEELARSNRELEYFAYVASHDLQEPLRMVATYTQLLAERYRGKLDSQAEKYIHYAVDGAKRMQTLIQDLLAFSRVGRQDTKMAPVDCNLILQQALESLQVSIRESGAVLTYGRLPKVIGNSSQLLQVFSNLIANAIKFRGRDKPKVHIGTATQAGEYLFSVRDNGIGIAPENAQEVFVIFRRLHTRGEYPGNGIGLAMCRKIVEQHGGKIWVTSREGHGSTFTFTLPVPEFGPVKDKPEQEYVHA